MEAIFKKGESNLLAGYVVDYCVALLRPVTNLQLQKILFFMNYCYYCDHQKWLFEENFEAWQYGPVLPSVYENYKFNKAYWLMTRHNLDEDRRQKITKPDESTLTKEGLNAEYIKKAIRILSKVSAVELVNESHKAGKSWARNYKENERNVISREDLLCDVNERENGGYFRGLL